MDKFNEYITAARVGLPCRTIWCATFGPWSVPNRRLTLGSCGNGKSVNFVSAYLVSQPAMRSSDRQSNGTRIVTLKLKCTSE